MPLMNSPMGAESIDIPFQIPSVHRLRFTGDVLGDDQNVLADLLEPSGDRPPLVQFWLDEHVDQARPDLRGRLAPDGVCHLPRAHGQRRRVYRDEHAGHARLRTS